MDPEKRVSRLIDNIKESKINPHNKQKIIEFVNDLRAKSKSPNTIIKYVYPLYQMNSRRWITKNFEDLTKEDLKGLIATSNSGVSKTGKAWSGKTKKNFKLTVKVFYRWLEGIDEPRYYPERVRWITSTIPKKERRELMFDDLLTRNEVIEMAKLCLNPMHKALIWVIFESTGRPEEVLSMRASDIKFDSKGAVVLLRGAKDKRPSRLVSSVEPLRSWLRVHPLRNEKDYPVWTTQFNKKKKIKGMWSGIGNAGANKVIKQMALRAGITKRVTMYSMRRGRITELAKSDISSPLMKSIVGWTQSSTVADRYIKFSSKEIDSAVLKSNGFMTDMKEKIESFVECKWCGCKCSPGSLYCENPKCGKPLIITDSEIDALRTEMSEMIDSKLSQANKILDKILKASPEFEKAYIKELEKIGNQLK